MDTYSIIVNCKLNGKSSTNISLIYIKAENCVLVRCQYDRLPFTCVSCGAPYYFWSWQLNSSHLPNFRNSNPKDDSVLRRDNLICSPQSSRVSWPEEGWNRIFTGLLFGSPQSSSVLIELTNIAPSDAPSTWQPANLIFVKWWICARKGEITCRRNLPKLKQIAITVNYVSIKSNINGLIENTGKIPNIAFFVRPAFCFCAWSPESPESKVASLAGLMVTVWH